jgi:glutamyl-tRNA synthetase
LHPEEPGKGFREYTVTPKGEEQAVTFSMARNDAENAESGMIIRLMELFNVRIQKVALDAKTPYVEATFVSESYEDVRQTKPKLIHWIPTGDAFPCRVLMPDATANDGVAESVCKKLKPDTVIQFERFGFVRVDEVAEKLTAYYAHK